MVIDLIGKQYEEETHILARVRLNQLRVNRQQSGTAFHKRAGTASATNSVSLGFDCRVMELRLGTWQPRCHRRAQRFAQRKRGNRAGAASAWLISFSLDDWHYADLAHAHTCLADCAWEWCG